MSFICLRGVLQACDHAGQPLPRARLYVYYAGTEALAPVYSYRNRNTMQPNPMTADENGVFDGMYLLEGTYSVSLFDDREHLVTSEIDIDNSNEPIMNVARVFKSFPDLMADTTLRYRSSTCLHNVEPVDQIHLSDSENCYIIADATAADHHLTTAGGLKLYIKAQANGYDVKAFGAIGDGVANDTAAIDAAIASLETDPSLGGRLIFPPGRYLSDGGHIVNITGHQILGAGIDATRLIFNPSSTQTGMFILGNKTGQTVVKQVSLKDMRIEMQGTDKYGVEMYGCRDGSEISNVYISDFSGSAVRLNMAGDGTGSATGKMNQGVKLAQVICESSQDVTAPNGVFDIDGTFETTLDTCAFKGASGSNNNGKAITIGLEAECRNLVILNTALPHLKNGGAGGNVGIHYGQWARECRDLFTTFENIDGHAVLFDGSAVSGIELPFQCCTLFPRLYQVDTVGVLDPAFVFGDSHSCRVGPISSYQSNKIWAKFNSFTGFQEKNVIEIGAGDVQPDTIVGANIVFDPTTPGNNVVSGFSSNDNSLRSFTLNNTGVQLDLKPNGTTFTYSGSWDTISLGGSTGTRWRDSANVDLFQLVQGGNLALDQTVAYLRYRGSSGETVQRVLVGAPDSGGTGFRNLIVPN